MDTSHSVVELHQAWVWDCPECGREHLVRGYAPSLTDEEKAEIVEKHGFDASRVDLAVFTVHPTLVGCEHCRKSFGAVIPSKEPEVR